MRINFLVPDLKLSGGGKVVCEYARRLAARNHQVTITARQKHLGWVRNIIHLLVDTVSWINLKEVKVKFVPSFDEIYIPESDIILATSWRTAEVVNNLALSKGRKFYLIQHMEDMISHTDASMVKATYLFPMTKIAVSRWIQGELTRRFNQASEYIPNAVDGVEFFPENKTYGQGCLGMLYHTADWKGVNDGLKAVEIARQSFSDIKLVLFGTRHHQPVNLGDTSEYYHRPTGSKLRKIYSSCDIFICPSWYEGFGLPGLEAMACKSALVTTDNGGCRDYAIHNETALVSPIKKPQALAENIIRLLTDQALLRRISETGYQMAQRFNWESSVEKMEALIRA